MASADWKAVSDPFVCSLTHNIPNFGKLVLARKAGAPETMQIQTLDKISFPPGPTGMETFPPVWRNDLLPKPLGSFMAVAGKTPISLNAAQIAAVVGQLSGGTRVMFTSQPVRPVNSSQGLLVMRIVLEARNFAAGYKAYQDCTKDLITYGLAQVARTTLTYAEQPEGLTAAQKTALGRVARYVKVDPKVAAIIVDGHSDNGGTAEVNDTNSRQQAEATTAFLVAQGIPADKIITRWHADKFPIADNKTAAGRAQNRRVTVRLEDEATREAIEKRVAEERAKAEQKSQSGTQENQTGEAGSDAKSSNPSGKMTPEEISRMVEGLDLIDANPH